MTFHLETALLSFTPDAAEGAQFQILLATPDFAAVELDKLNLSAILTPLASETGLKSRSYSWFIAQDQGYLAQSFQFDEKIYYQIVLIPEELWSRLGSDLEMILDVMVKPENKLPQLLSKISLREDQTWTSSRRLAVIGALFEIFPSDGLKNALAILDPVILGQGVLLKEFPAEAEKRLLLVRALMKLLPNIASHLITFSSNSAEILSVETCAIVFGNQEISNRAVFEFINPPQEPVFQSSYCQYLWNHWDGDLSSLNKSLRAIDILAPQQRHLRDVYKSLNSLIQRLDLDSRVKAGDAILETAELKQVLTSDIRPQGELYDQYLQHLLNLALSERDPESINLVAKAMQESPHLRNQLLPVFEEQLHSQPDDVYTFIRTWFQNGIDPFWTPMLESSARAALKIAIDDADPDIIISWLRLIAREPAEWGLSEILKEALLLAKKRASEDGELAMQLLRMAVRYHADIADTLLEDKSLTSALPTSVYQALIEHDPTSIETLPDLSRELFALALRQSLKNQKSINNTILLEAWKMYQNKTGVIFQDAFRPRYLIRDLLSLSDEFIPAFSLEALLMAMLVDDNRDAFLEAIPRVKDRANLTTLISSAFIKSDASVNLIIELIGRLENDNLIEGQQSVDIVIDVLVAWGWDDSLAPLAEHLVRVLKQDPDIEIAIQHLWQLIYLSNHVKSESIGRVVLPHLLKHFSEIGGAKSLLEQWQRIRDQVEWNPNLIDVIDQWWNQEVRKQSLTELQQLEALLIDNKALTRERRAIRTSIAVRKILGQRSMERFAEQLDTVHAVLQALSDSLDDDNKLDPSTLYAELQEHSASISPEQRHILATNLKDLSQLIVNISANRTRSSLMRSDDQVDRQFFAGEEAPRSAIDLMKWLSGYFDGLHRAEDED